MIFLKDKYFFNILLLIWVISIPFKNAIYQISTVLLIIFFVIYIIQKKDYDSVKNIFLKYKDISYVFLLIILSMTISNFININATLEVWSYELSYIYRYGFISFILLFFYYKEFFSKKTLIIFILISLSSLSLDGVYQAITGFDLFKRIEGNIYKGLTGYVFNRNVFSFFMGLGALIVSILLISKCCSYRDRVILVTLLTIFTFGVLFGYSRTIWVALFTCLLIYIIINKTSFNKVNIFFLIGIVVVLILIFLNVDSLHKRFEMLLEGKSSGRFEIWSHTLNLIMEKPLFGWGLDAWEQNQFKYYNNVHNVILEILLCLGFFGLFFYSLFIYFTIKEIFDRKEINLFLIFLFLVIAYQFESSIFFSKVSLNSIVILVFFIFSSRIKLDKGEIK